MKWILGIVAMVLTAGSCIALARQGPAQSPASQRPPQTVTPQSYPAEVVLAGQTRFASECAFCHGRDAAGGETGPDLTRSVLVAEDSRGDKIGVVVRSGRVEKGMPSFEFSDSDLGAIVAFIHDQKAKGEALGGGRRSVEVSDLQTGNADAGRQYFNTAGCSSCHSPTGDLAGLANRFRGLPLLERMLYPSGVRPLPAPAKVTVATRSGETITGSLVSHDEFTIVMKDSAGSTHTWNVDEVKYTIEDGLRAHFDQLEKYTDDDIHNLYAYLQTLL